MTGRRTIAWMFTAALLLGGATARAQQPPAGAPPAGPGGQGRGGTPPPPQNLQVLPKEIPREQLLNLMRGISQGLGVQCSYCHIAEGRGGRNDFASDDKQPKKTARVMMQLTQRVNETISTGIGKTAADVTRVGCFTCHRGKAIPDPVPPVAPPAQQAPGAPGGSGATPGGTSPGGTSPGR
jgi:hypothetical protein